MVKQRLKILVTETAAFIFEVVWSIGSLHYECLLDLVDFITVIIAWGWKGLFKLACIPAYFKRETKRGLNADLEPVKPKKKKPSRVSKKNRNNCPTVSGARKPTSYATPFRRTTRNSNKSCIAPSPRLSKAKAFMDRNGSACRTFGKNPLYCNSPIASRLRNQTQRN